MDQVQADVLYNLERKKWKNITLNRDEFGLLYNLLMTDEKHRLYTMPYNSSTNNCKLPCTKSTILSWKTQSYIKALLK